MVGLWEAFTWPDQRIERSYGLGTVPALGDVVDIHERMPLVIEQKYWPLWLGEEPGDVEALLQLAEPDALTVRRVAPARRRQ